MPRHALLLEYDGRGFAGWQRQDGQMTVQQALEEAAARLALSQAPSSAAAGRTDAGVHAGGQVAHLDLDRPLEPARLRDALNVHLRPHPVAILAAAPVAADWHARFNATGRAYRYVILDRPAPPALEAGRVWHVPRRLDAAAMHHAAQVLVGRHDFSSFRAAACQAKDPVKTLARLDAARHGDHVVIVAEARSFLHHQVRNMVGTLVRVGQGRWTAADVRVALDARDRAAAGRTAPAEGLCLTGVTHNPAPLWADG
jgi:tRNA pseudouridine38-40 synthase